MSVFRCGLGVAFVMTLGAIAPAAAAPEDDYVALMTAVEIDRTCPALKYMEWNYARRAASDYLGNATEYRLSMDGRLPQEEYDAWFAQLEDKVRANAAAVGCTQQAMQYILPAKAKAAEKIYQGLVLAFHFDASQNALDHIPLDDHKRRTASGYDAYLQQLYGESFPAFVARQRELAAQELPAQQFNPFGDYGISTLLDPVAIEASYSAQSIARAVMNDVQFEVTAEANGFLVRPRELPSGRYVPELHRAGSAEVLPVVKEPGYSLVSAPDNTLDELYSLIVLLPDRRMRILYYGDSAANLVAPTIRLYVRTESPPPGSNPWGLFDIPGFRNGATAFEATLATGQCLGAPCYDLPVEATEAMLADLEGYYSEMFVAYEPGAEPAPITATSLGRDRFSNATLWELLK